MTKAQLEQLNGELHRRLVEVESQLTASRASGECGRIVIAELEAEGQRWLALAQSLREYYKARSLAPDRPPEPKAYPEERLRAVRSCVLRRAEKGKTFEQQEVEGWIKEERPDLFAALEKGQIGAALWMLKAENRLRIKREPGPNGLAVWERVQ